MNDVKQEYVTLELQGRAYPICLDLNLICLLQERYGDLNAVLEKSREPGELRWILWAFLQEGIAIHNDESPEIWEELTVNQAGRMITAANLPKVNEALLAAFGASLPQSEEQDDDADEKNGLTG